MVEADIKMTDQNTIEPEVDEELLELAQESTPSILRPLLMIGVIAMAFWVVSDWRAELEYFFSPEAPVAIGDVTEFAEKSADPEWKPDIPHNRYISLEGIPTQRSISSRYRYGRLVGGWVFIEETLTEEEMEKVALGEKDGEVDRTYFKGTGRVMEFAEVPGRYNGLREYYRSRYGVEFCETLTPEVRKTLEARRRDVIREGWKREYGENATPTEAEIEEIMTNNPLCQNAYLVQVGVAPKDHIWYAVASALFALFALVNFGLLIRWVRAFFR